MKKVVLKENHLIYGNGNYLEQYLGFLKIKPEDINSFIKCPRETDYLSPNNLYNIDKAATEYDSMCRNLDGGMFVQIDSDTDGYTSASIIISYTKRRYPDKKIDYRLHVGKEHGIIVDTVPENTNLVIIPDAGTNQFNEQNNLVDNDIKVIVLDHHELSGEKDLKDTKAIIVNNQFGDYNKCLSGAGVVLKFIQYVDEHFFANETPIWQEYMDVAAIGIIADAMNMCNLDNNYISYTGLNHINNKFISALALKQARGIKDPEHLTKKDVMWYIAPVINGVIRGGTPEDKQAVFDALISINGEADMYEHKWRGVTKYENIYERACRLAANAKSRQDSSKKKAFEEMKKSIQDEGLDKNNIIIVALDSKKAAKISANLTGLIAMELVKEFNKPCLVLRETEYDGMKMYGGSGRNGVFFNLPDFKAALHDAGAYYGEGHSNAFGAFLKPEEIATVTEYFNSNYNAEDFLDEVFEVDYWFHTGETIDKEMLTCFASVPHLYGNSIPAPKFAFDVNVGKNDYFAMGANKTSLKINYDGVDFVSFDGADIIDTFNKHFKDSDSPIHVQIVGFPNLNEWNGRVTIQIMIDDIDIKEIKKGETANKVSLADLI